ncbi:MAG: MCP four helix bundle domain-containing protein, partial [Nitrospira sp.]|nr:MCP four helix bundle domain-containing protein [Nitrospira sp.]
MPRSSKATVKPTTSWFQNLKTLPKLILGFAAVSVIMVSVGLVGLMGLHKLKGELQSIYNGSTLALSNVGISSTTLGLYHSALLNVGRQTNRSNFEESLVPLAELKRQTLAPLEILQSSQLHESSTGRSERKDLAELHQALREYFSAAEGVLRAFADSFGSSLADEQKESMHNLAQSTLSVEVANKYGAATLRVRELMTTIQEVAKELNDNGQAEASYRTNIVFIGAVLALILAGAIGYFLARTIARNIVHVADVAQQAAAGNLQARARLES